MSGTVHRLPSGVLKVCTVQFYCQPSSAQGTVIHLGAFAELLLPRVRGLGLMARTNLGPQERALLGELGGRSFARPFDYLRAEFDQVWAAAKPGHALETLAGRHHSSLVIGGVEERRVPNNLLIGAHGEVSPTVVLEAKRLILENLNDKVLEMIWDDKPPTTSEFQELEIDWDRQKAANF